MKLDFIPVGRIKRAHNHRTYFDSKENAEMQASIRAGGIDTPITVRPLTQPEPGYDYELVIGGRRCYNAEIVGGPDFVMPAIIRELSDVEARLKALTENVQRADVSAAEEAIEAAGILGISGGDRDETARRLGWSRSTLDSRLALLNCSEAVLEALTTRKISLGHAELLAAIAKPAQDKVIPVIVAEKRTVAEVRKLIEQVACSLSAAIFDKADCAGCAHNSALQAEMFGEAISTGNCTNPTCFNEKTEAQLEVTLASLRDEFPLVRIVRPGDNETRVQLLADGPKGVGAEQATACRACQKFGAAVSGLPGSMGNVYRGQCFDTVCNMKKVAARIQAEKTLIEGGKADGNSTAAKVPKGGGGSGGSPASANPTVTVIAESDKVKSYRVNLWRKALRADIGMNHELARQYLIAVVLSGNARQIADSAFRKFFDRIAGTEAPIADFKKSVEAVQGTNEAAQADLMLAMTFAAIEGLDVVHLTQLCKVHKLDLKKHWKLDKAFLELITKSEMMVLADELGIRSRLADNFKKVFAKSKPEVIEALLKVEGFDYEGKLPKVLKF